MIFRIFGCVCLLASIMTLGACYGLVNGVAQLTVNVAGAGQGTVTSQPAGINCPGTCSVTLRGVTQVVLTAQPGPGFGFGGWTGTSPCNNSQQTTCTVSTTANVTATFTASLQSVNHIVFLAQENRSFDSYFGALRAYWAQNGIPDQQFDGLAQFNPPANPAAAPAVPGCNPLTSTPLVCHVDPATGDVGPPVQSFQFNSMCVENPSPSWNESHGDWNASDPVNLMATLDGFVRTAANDARQHSPTPLFDVNGVRSMGYYDGTDFNYYYALASTFSTSDAWFSAVMTRTPPNREFLIAATSHGYVYQRGANPPADSALIPSTTIFEALQNAGVSWKIYVNPKGTPCQNNPTDVACLVSQSYLHDFVFGQTIATNPGAYANNIVPITQFYTDALSGQLPAVAQIEPASSAGLDEHPTDNDPPPGVPPCCSVQAGANYVSTLINAVMCGVNGPPSGACTPGPSWQDTVFVLTFDEAGGFYDHVAPQTAISPDGIAPVDLFPGDVCTSTTGPNCDFVLTGYRVPLVVVSPYTKKNFVSHQVRDFTAILKLIEARFLNSTSLTARDAAQVGMDDPTTGFFDFNTAPWKVPPTNLPAQTVLDQSRCYLDHLP